MVQHRDKYVADPARFSFLHLTPFPINVVSSRLASGTAEIQSNLKAGDMHTVNQISRDLEPTVEAVRALEAKCTELTAQSIGKVEFVAVEESIKALTASSAVTMTPVPGTTPSVTPARGRTPGTPFTPGSTGRGTAVPNAIYINGVPEDTTEADLREVFARFGDIKMINSRHIATGGVTCVFLPRSSVACQGADDQHCSVLQASLSSSFQPTQGQLLL